MSDPTGAQSVSLDEMTEPTAEKPKLADVVFEGDDVPVEMRGKSAAELMKLVSSSMEAVKISEDARRQAEARAAQSSVAPPPVVELPKTEPELNDEELAELHQQDPLKAIRYIEQRAVRKAEQNLETRLGPMVSASATDVENRMREKYKEDFELFGDQITRFASQIPNAKSVLANPDNWDTLIASVRGRPENLDKIVQRRINTAVPDRATTARADQAASIGFTDSGSGGRRVATTVAQLDPIQLEIAEKLGLTPAEYIHWGNVGTRLS